MGFIENWESKSEAERISIIASAIEKVELSIADPAFSEQLASAYESAGDDFE